MAEQLITPTMLFRFSVPCRATNKSWSADDGLELTPKYTIPSFQSELGEQRPFGDLRIAWSDEGIVFNLQVREKKQAPWCRESRLEESDGLTLWVDTRDMQDVHRASRFCHQFVFLPQGQGAKQESPVAELLNIQRAKDNPKQPARDTLLVRSEKRVDGYVMHGFMPACAITGYDPKEHPKLGFCYAIADREMGWQTWSLGSEYPFQTDPSLWGTLELVS